MKKLLAVGVIVLFLGLAIAPSTGNRMFNDDTTPPVTTISFDPPEPDGDKGWYVNDVNVTLNATDDMSGVDRIEYKIHSGSWQTIPGNYGTFIVDIDVEDLLIEYYAIDNAGNEETHQIVTIDMDQTIPELQELIWETYSVGDRWFFHLVADSMDSTSCMNRVEFYMNEELQETITGSGPIYEWDLEIDVDYGVFGFIWNRQITEENVSFFAICIDYDKFIPQSIIIELTTIKVVAYDDAGNSVYVYLTFDGVPPHPDPPIKFTLFTFPNDYTGYIGRFFIWATFEKEPYDIEV